MSGCLTHRTHAGKEKKVDEALATALIPSGAPEAGPGEPQESFDQEVIQSQNP